MKIIYYIIQLLLVSRLKKINNLYSGGLISNGIIFTQKFNPSYSIFIFRVFKTLLPYYKKPKRRIFRYKLRRVRKTMFIFKRGKWKNLFRTRLTQYYSISFIAMNLLFFNRVFIRYQGNKFFTSNLLWNYNYFLQTYFFSFLFIPFKIKLVNASNLIAPKLLFRYTRILTRLTPRSFKFIYIEELAELFLAAFLTKNISFFWCWIKKTLEFKPLSMFTGFVNYFNKILRRFALPLYKKYNIKGISLQFYGKFMRGGGKKKRRILQYGKTSYTTKSLKLVYKKFYIRTISGIIGCTFLMGY